MEKLSIFLKMITVVKNWHLILFVYAGIYKKEFFSLELKNGLKVKLRTDSTDLQAFANVWILKEYENKHFEISENDVIIDVGGHVGLFALFASTRIQNGKIISVEPHPGNFSLLQENMDNNELHGVVLVNKAVANSNGTVRLFLDGHDDSAHSICGKGDNSIQIEGVTLNKLVRDAHVSKYNVLKMDCEGAEFEIIESLSDDELARIEKICLEYHLNGAGLSYLEKLEDRLKKMSFAVSNIPTNNHLGMLYAKKSQTQ